MKRLLSLTLNGRARDYAVADNLLLVDFLREVVGLTGTKMGCDGGECGACTVLVDDKPRLSCITLAQTCSGRRVETVESLENADGMSPVQSAFHEALGAQCGFCTPGMVMSAEGLLRGNASPSDDEIKNGMASNICRCTGYVKIIDAVRIASKQRRYGKSAS